MSKPILIIAVLLLSLANLLWRSEEAASSPVNSTYPDSIESSRIRDLFVPLEVDLPTPPSLSLFDPQGAVQIGVQCVAVPQCPDCTRGGNVCRGVQEFYGGLLGAAVAKKALIAKCQQANALDYCGGSAGCRSYLCQIKNDIEIVMAADVTHSVHRLLVVL